MSSQLMSTAADLILAAPTQVPEDTGKSGPMGLLILVVGLVVVGLLVRSMTTHLKRIPASFATAAEADLGMTVPDDPGELVDLGRRPGEDLLDTLRRAPRAIEAPPEDGARSG